MITLKKLYDLFMIKYAIFYLPDLKSTTLYCPFYNQYQPTKEMLCKPSSAALEMHRICFPESFSF